MKPNIQCADRNIPSAANLPRRRLVFFMRVVVVLMRRKARCALDR